MRRRIVGELSFQLIALTLRLWGHCWISTERARAVNTAIVGWAIRAAGHK